MFGGVLGGWQAALAAFLANACSVRQMELWVQYNAPAIEKTQAFTEARSDPHRLAGVIVSEIARQGLATDALFDDLAALAGTPIQILEPIRAMWRISGTHPPPIAAPRPAIPPAPAPTAPAPGSVSAGASTQEASHTSIVLDRLEPWKRLVKHCSERRREHTAFLVHGSVEQDLHLFLRRITSFLNPQLSLARKPVHQLLQVERTKDGTSARTAEDWQRSLVRATQNRRGEIEPALMEEAASVPVLIVFTDTKGPLRGLDKASIQGLIECLRRVDHALVALERAKRIKNPVRFVIPIEHWPTGAGADPVVQELAAALGRAQALKLPEPLGLTFPLWDEVRNYILGKYPDAPGTILDACQAIHRDVAGSAGRTLQQLGDAIDDALYEWKTPKYYMGR